MTVLHQFLTGAVAGDAITAQAFTMQRWLQEAGLTSRIYAEHIHDNVAERVKPLSLYRRARGEKRAIYHHSTGSAVAGFLLQRGLRLLLVHHNVTPPHYFARIDPAWTARAGQGERQLALLQPHADLALADSPFNEADLRAAGYEKSGVLPITLDESAYEGPGDRALAERLQQQQPLLLFVGRLAPNKKQEDLVKLLFHYRRLQPTAQLALVGDRWTMGYDRWVDRVAAELDVAEAVTMPGKVSQQALLTYYRQAALYVSMSEHEGFGKPLLESMFVGLPVLAYGAASVPGTMGDAGVLFRRKDFGRLAELVDILVTDTGLRTRLAARQRERIEDFLPARVRHLFLHYLEQLGISGG